MLINLEISTESEHEFEIKKLRNRESITDEEYYHLTRLLFIDRAYFVDETESVDVSYSLSRFDWRFRKYSSALS